MKVPVRNSAKVDLLENAPAMLALHDLDHTIVWANRAYREAAGMPLGDIAGAVCYAA